MTQRLPSHRRPRRCQQFGFDAVVAPSFSDIFSTNCTKNGLLPVVLPESDVRDLMVAGEASIDLAAQTVTFAGRSVGFAIDPSIKHRLLLGLDEIGLTLEHEVEIDAYEETHALFGSRTTEL